MRESRSYGSVLGAISDGRPYRNSYARFAAEKFVHGISHFWFAFGAIS